MDDAALRIDRSRVRLLVRCRETREQAAKRAHWESLHVLELARAAEQRAKGELVAHRAAQTRREQEVMVEVQAAPVAALRLQRYRQEIEAMAAIGESMVRAVEQAAHYCKQADAARAASHRVLIARARDRQKWVGVHEKVVRVQDIAVERAEEHELDESLADRYASVRK